MAPPRTTTDRPRSGRRTRDLEVVVVGAGPAGTTAARLLAERGAHVRLLEARPLPRFKLCGGGVTPKAMPYLPDAALARVERRVVSFELAGGRFGRPVLRLEDVEIAMVERAPFDAALAEAAVRAGADLIDDEPAIDAHPATAGGGRPSIGTRAGRIEADVVIAADGEPSRVAARAGLRSQARRLALGLEVDLPLDPARSPTTLQLRFGVPAGYAWLFPKGDHANVGILTTDRRRTRSLGDALRRYIVELGLDPAGGRVRGHWIPMSLREGPLESGQMLLAGDAAGAADPFFGEGIAYALASGAIAAGAIADWAEGRARSVHAYEQRLRRALEPGFSRLMLVGAIAERIPSLAIPALAGIPWARGEARRGLLGLGAPFALPAPPRLDGPDGEPRSAAVSPSRAPRG
jgi:geranylgeranyl reductase family protein